MTVRLFGLEVGYNNNKPFHCVSGEHAGIGAQLYDIGDRLNLIIYVKTQENRRQYKLNGILPGDRLVLRYLTDQNLRSPNINEMEALSRTGESSILRPGFKIGLDVKLKSGKTVRVSHPEDLVEECLDANQALEECAIYLHRAHWSSYDSVEFEPRKDRALKRLRALRK